MGKHSFSRFSLVILLIAAMMLCMASAMAEKIDLKALSNDELTALLDQTNAEMVRRGISKTATLAKGTYTAGVDLPAGKYTFTCLATGSDWGNVTVQADHGTGNLVLWEVVSAPKNGEAPETIYMTLHDGDELESGVPFSLTIGAGITFQ